MSTVLSTFGFKVFNGFEVWLALYPRQVTIPPRGLYIHVLGGFGEFLVCKLVGVCRFRRLKLDKSLVFKAFNNLSSLRITAYQFKTLAA